MLINYKDLIRFYLAGNTAKPKIAVGCILGKYLNSQRINTPFRVIPNMGGTGGYFRYRGEGHDLLERMPMERWQNELALAFDQRCEYGEEIDSATILSLIREFIGTEAYEDALEEIAYETEVEAMEKELVHA